MLTLVHFGAAHLGAVKAFAQSLPAHDLLFLSRDIKQPKVISAWLNSIADGEISSLVAMEGDKVVGTTAIVRDPLGWSAHVAELRILISEEMRGKGLGRILLQHCFVAAIENGAEKLMARMTPDQRGAISLFEEMGFRGEAMLRDHVRDSEGKVHDLAILSLDVARAEAQHGAFGFNDA
ncbi:MAG: GNAT family N-acetyltransferase [Sphingomonadales bacterium]|nr:GNAT family N-acetyltransferase [Sphingomonadales bacterium]